MADEIKAEVTAEAAEQVTEEPKTEAKPKAKTKKKKSDVDKFIERKLKVINEDTNKARAKRNAERVLRNK